MPVLAPKIKVFYLEILEFLKKKSWPKSDGTIYRILGEDLFLRPLPEFHEILGPLEACPFRGMKPNCALSKSKNARIPLSNTRSIIFLPCSSSFTPLYESQFITSTFPLKIGTTALVFHSSGITFLSKTRWQSCSITSSVILPPATITTVVI